MLGNIFNKDKNDDKENEKEAQLQATVKNLTDQIASLRKELQEKNTKIEQLQSEVNTAKKQATDLQGQLKTAQTSSSSASQSAQKAASDLQAKLNSANETIAQKDKLIAELQAKLAAAGSSASAPSLQVGGQAWVTRAGGGSLRLRSGPGLSHDVLGNIAPGSQLTLLEGPQAADNYSWWKVRTTDNREGWVAGQDLRTAAD
jgi:Tfp pilus assembly protein FimV